MASWGTALRVITSPVAIAAGTAKGTFNVLSGSGSFDGGFSEVLQSTQHNVQEFGDKYADTLTKTTIGLVAAVLVGEIKRIRD
jgi:hypothetical protein